MVGAIERFQKDSESFKFASGEFAAVVRAVLLSRTSKESSSLL